MNEIIEAHPLCWPAGYDRTKHPVKSRFRTSQFSKVRSLLFSEVKRLGGISPVLSTNIPLRNDGLPFAKYSRLEDHGAALYFTYKGNQVCFACDRWNDVMDNIYAIALTIDAIRSLDRWGVSDMLDRVFTGFKQLPPGSEVSAGMINIKTILQWFCLDETAYNSFSNEQLKNHYRIMAKRYHPDNQDSFFRNEENFKLLNEAWEKIKKIRNIV